MFVFIAIFDFFVISSRAEDILLRLIVSSINSPFNALSAFVLKIITHLVRNTSIHMRNSSDLIEKFSHIKHKDNFVTASFVVVNL